MSPFIDTQITVRNYTFIVQLEHGRVATLVDPYRQRKAVARVTLPEEVRTNVEERVKFLRKVARIICDHYEFQVKLAQHGIQILPASGIPPTQLAKAKQADNFLLFVQQHGHKE